MSYIQNDFLLQSETAQTLYFDYAEKMPIFDYHCHLSEKQILENKPFDNIFDIWLAGDHYKWRLMRNYGVDEELITGSADKKSKFKAYCTALGTAFGNPLYHWSQVELKTFFGCEKEINGENAEEIWQECNAYIQAHAVTPQSLIEKSNVTCLFTTNEVFDDLTTFQEIAKKDYKFRVYPAFRADKIMNITADGYNDILAKLEAQTHKISDVASLEQAIEKRLAAFLAVGCKASDIAVQRVYPVASRSDADKILKARRKGKAISNQEGEIFQGYLTYYLFRLYAKHNLVTELHVGAMRNNNAAMFQKLGADTGYDSIAEDNSIYNMSRLFDKLNSENALPKTIVFNLNPKMNAEIMTLIGCFQDGTAKGKIQYGAAWWFLDNKVGMEKHLQDLTATGHIASFVGMLTDSRSFLSYPRHHYFRRILCNYLGGMMERGEMTNDVAFVGKVVEDVCFQNASNYFGL